MHPSPILASLSGTSSNARVNPLVGHFPALAARAGQRTIYLDNAGGAQLPIHVIDAARDYLINSYVQTGANYAASQHAARTVADAHSFVSEFLNAGQNGHVLLGGSSTAVLHMVANAYADALHAGKLTRNRIVVSTTGHEANIGPWDNLRSRGFEVVLWDPTKDRNGDVTLTCEGLEPLLTPRTLLVAFPQVSNILGDIWDVTSLCALAKSKGVLTCVDGVAYAPHHLPDVAAIGCDWYVYSTYKVFGPHMGAIWGTNAAFEPLTGANHSFIPRDPPRYKFELGGCSHEGCAMINGGLSYYRAVAGPGETREVLVRAFELFTSIELPLQHMLIEGLRSIPGVELVGPARSDASRVSTVSCKVAGRTSASLALALNAQGLGVKHGHFYSKRLLDYLGFADPSDGVLRISLAHYNTPADVDAVLTALAAQVG